MGNGGWERLRGGGRFAADLASLRIGELLARNAGRLLAWPYRNEAVELPRPYRVGAIEFDIVDDLVEYTGLSRTQVERLLRRRIENFRTEWFALPAELREERWFYLSSRTYLFANAGHLYDSPGVFALLERATAPEARVLDYGGGTGNVALALAAAGRRIDYLELSALQKDFVAFRARRYGLDDRVSILVPGQEIPASTYDLVCALDVLEHVPDPVAVVRDVIVPSLAPDGRLAEISPFLVNFANPMHHTFEGNFDAALETLDLRLVEEAPECRLWVRV